MWYHRCSVEFLLHHGKASWSDILWQLDATGRLPHDTLVEPLLAIERAWDGDVYLRKMAVNSLIGLWASTKTHAFSVLTSSEPHDCPTSLLKRHFAYGAKFVIDHISATPLVDNATMRPLHDLVMAAEATRMAQLHFVVTKLGCPPRAVKDVKTDALILSVPTRRRPLVREVASLRYDQLHTLRRDYELPTDPDQMFLNAHAEMTPILSSDPVFRFSEVGIPLSGRYSKPERCVPPPTEIAPWRDLTEEEATATVMSGSSLAIFGAPGTGKTFFARQLILALREQGRRVDVVWKTHAATQNVGVAGAETADHWVRTKVRTGGLVPCHVLFIEEITMMDAQLWSDVCKLHLSGRVACVLSGDFVHLPPVL
jgi:hypothetical protein